MSLKNYYHTSKWSKYKRKHYFKKTNSCGISKYSDERNCKSNMKSNWDNLPNLVSYKNKKNYFYKKTQNRYILDSYFKNQIGRDWDDILKEITYKSGILPKNDCFGLWIYDIFLSIEKFDNGRLWVTDYEGNIRRIPKYNFFYVCPDTNILKKYEYSYNTNKTNLTSLNIKFLKKIIKKLHEKASSYILLDDHINIGVSGFYKVFAKDITITDFQELLVSTYIQTENGSVNNNIIVFKHNYVSNLDYCVTKSSEPFENITLYYNALQLIFRII